ncbi:MAG: NAD-dependent epimerase/dehydratase family protein [Deferrisomatales bacterium]|nr:NAD-dependent epimerase/dehydratase family protein [Deferrisomatales bacterium]
MARVLLTGGAGFIGSHTADELIRRGHSVRALDLLDPQIHGAERSWPSHLHPDVEKVMGDVRDVEQATRALAGIDAVVHLAAQTGVGQSMYEIRGYVDANCTGTAALIQALVQSKQKIKRFVLASSRAVYGEGGRSCDRCGPLFPGPRCREDMEHGRFDIVCPRCGEETRSIPTAEDAPTQPLSVYAWTKRKQEELCQFAAQTYGLPVTILRYFNVYGSRQSLLNPYTGVVSIFYSRLLASQPISIYERGKPERDFIHVSDVVQANLLALDAEVPPGTCINVGQGTVTTIPHLARALAQACDRTADLQDTGEFRAGDILSCYADLQRSDQLLGYQPNVTLEAGMAEFVAWARGQAAVDRYQTTVEELERHGLFGRAAARST